MQPSTSSTYSSSLLKLEKALDIAPKESMKQLLAIDTTSLEGVDRLSLKEKQEVYHKMSLLKKEENDFRAACEYADAYTSLACLQKEAATRILTPEKEAITFFNSLNTAYCGFVELPESWDGAGLMQSSFMAPRRC